MSWRHELGRQLRIARKAAGLTQTKLASQLKVTRQMVYRYEAGLDAPAVDVLARAATVLDVEFQVLGLRVTFQATPVRPVHTQLSFPFNKPRSFQRAIVKITPHKGRILITADIPA